jgi:hypothetical protein
MKGLLSCPKNFENSGLNMCWAIDNKNGVARLTPCTDDGFKKNTIK